MMQRMKGWDGRLDAWLRSMRAHGHSWGENDCALFCASAIRVMTGVDIAAPYRGTYTNAREADQVLRSELLCNDISDLPGKFLPSRALPDAGRGDVLLMAGEQDYLAIHWGEYAMAPGPDGLSQRPVALAQKAWAV